MPLLEQIKAQQLAKHYYQTAIDSAAMSSPSQRQTEKVQLRLLIMFRQTVHKELFYAQPDWHLYT